MSKFTFIERLKNELRSYEDGLAFYSSPEEDAPKFQPNPDDVSQLINAYDLLSGTLQSITKLNNK